jgi:hypothetical protein
VGGDLLYPHYLWDQNPKDLKNKRDSPPKRSQREILQQGAGSSGVLVRVPVATSEPAAVTSAKGRDEPMVRNLPEAEPGTSLLGASGINTPLQGADSTGIPVAGGDQGSLVPKIGGLRLAKKALSGCAR